MEPGDVVRIRAFNDVPEYLFRVAYCSVAWGYRVAIRPYPRHRRVRREAAIMQYDGGLYLSKAEAAKAQGFRDASHYWQVLADYVINERLR